MLRLLTKDSQPVRSWWYDLPDGTRFQSPRPESLYQRCITYDPQTPAYGIWYADMVHKVCLTMPPGVCIGDDEGHQHTEPLTFKKVQDFLKAVSSVALSLLKREPVYVSQAEADRRAFICSQCRYNHPITCQGCHGFITLAHVYLRGREVRNQHELGACTICGCLLSVTCWCTQEILERVDKKHIDMFPPQCWRKHLIGDTGDSPSENKEDILTPAEDAGSCPPSLP